MGMLTIAEAKSFLGVSGSGDDTMIDVFIAAAVGGMEEYANRHLEETSLTEILDGTGNEKIWLKEPANAVSTIHVDSDQSWDSGSLVSSDDYLVDGCQIERLDSVWPKTQKNVRVVYTGGYADEDMPQELKHACMSVVGRMYTEWQAAKQGLNILSKHTVEGWSQTFIIRDGLGPEVEALLERGYRPKRW